MPIIFDANSVNIFTFPIASLVSPAPLLLSASDTVFIHALANWGAKSTRVPLDNSFQINFVFLVNNSTHFSV